MCAPPPSEGMASALGAPKFLEPVPVHLVPNELNLAGAAESAAGIVLARARESQEARAAMRIIASPNDALYLDFALASIAAHCGWGP
eukprot:4918434-Alexandrium_andersonii.AAC.1